MNNIPHAHIRRTIEQIKHCADEALSVVEHNEDYVHAINDLVQARELIDAAIPILRNRQSR